MMSIYQICSSPNQRVMKKKLTLILFALTILFVLSIINNANAAPHQLDPNKSNYVVIGAFSIPKNAIEFTENAKRNNFKAQFMINSDRKLFYVYVLHTEDKKMAIEEALKLRAASPFNDTWVFSGLLGEEIELAKGSDINPQNGEKIIKISPSDKNATSDYTANNSITSAPTSNEVTQDPSLAASTSPSLNTATTTSPIVIAEEGSKLFLFKVYTSSGQIQGDIDVMDLDKTKPKKIASYRSNEAISLKPANKSGNISFVCEVFGYRKIQTSANYNNPEATPGITIEENKTVVPFELTRLKKGDYAVMYNVYFYKDAGVMRPESKYEVNSLLEMLKENPKYKIRIHGHTNGNSAGKVISMGESKSFFSLTADVKEGFGSAKKLSEERALVIQKYLISQGIEPSRTEIKAWGGKKPIYEEDHALAHANVRVEIEIVEE
jgi:outer membrane protein OmpA-like peptidoglycan-associated protein